MSNDRIINRWSTGHAITASRLNNIVDAVNKNTQGLASPRQKPEYNEDKDRQDNGPQDLGAQSKTYNEKSRTFTTVTVTDSAGNTHSIEQIDSVTFEDGYGNELILNFSNP